MQTKPSIDKATPEDLIAWKWAESLAPEITEALPAKHVRELQEIINKLADERVREANDRVAALEQELKAAQEENARLVRGLSQSLPGDWKQSRP